MMKKCEICWDEFEPRSHNQKYCIECGKDPAKVRKHYEIAEYINKKNAGELEPKPVLNICGCGKKLFSIYDKKTCRECMEMKRIYNAKCPICNSLLFDRGVRTGRGFCSETCREKSRIQKAKEKGNYIECKICKKEFIAKNYKNVFCSRRCFEEHNRIQKEKSGINVFSLKQKKCTVCLKIFTIKNNNNLQKLCSKVCSQKYQKIKAQIKRDNAKKETNKTKDINLCISCKTPYIDCEYMTSRFVYMPVGAKKKEVDGKFIIFECPKHKN